MTNLDALRALRDAVKAGTDWISVLAANAFPPQQAVDACRAYGHEGQPGTAGSLDAAIALKDAVLPGWGAAAGFDYYTDFCRSRARVTHMGENHAEHIDGPSPQPARALLLAILSALIAAAETGPGKEG